MDQRLGSWLQKGSHKAREREIMFFNERRQVDMGSEKDAPEGFRGGWYYLLIQFVLFAETV